MPVLEIPSTSGDFDLYSLLHVLCIGAKGGVEDDNEQSVLNSVCVGGQLNLSPVVLHEPAL